MVTLNRCGERLRVTRGGEILEYSSPMFSVGIAENTSPSADPLTDVARQLVIGKTSQALWHPTTRSYVDYQLQLHRDLMINAVCVIIDWDHTTIEVGCQSSSVTAPCAFRNLKLLGTRQSRRVTTVTASSHTQVT